FLCDLSTNRATWMLSLSYETLSVAPIDLKTSHPTHFHIFFTPPFVLHLIDLSPNLCTTAASYNAHCLCPLDSLPLAKPPSRPQAAIVHRRLYIDSELHRTGSADPALPHSAF
ncbi:hypothetical protein PIB30_009590, partial [Stylosanthes scabra]|nr:hypothetical protein [Stylosanthes scabra]